MADHGLGPNAVEISDPDFASTFVLVGELIYIAQPDGVRVHPDTIFLTRAAAEKLCEAILDGIRGERP